MYIKNIVVSNFRCLNQNKFNFDKKMNIIYGNNGQGKTSLIEAVYFVATGKSFRTKKTSEQINYISKRATVFTETNENKYSIELLKDKRNFYIDKNKIKYSSYIGKILAVSFTPEDMNLISDNPDNRRKFFNYEISQTDSNYLKKIIEFQKVLKVRNKLLKEAKVNKEIFEIYNEKFIELSIDIYEIRKKYIEELSIIVNEKYKKLFNEDERVSIKYEAYYNFTTNDKKKELREYIEKKIEKEKMFGYTIVGPQKDEYVFYLNNQRVKSFASQGEKKSIIFSLKISQIEYILKKVNERPIFLLDDISAYFDENRQKSSRLFTKKRNTMFFYINK